MKRKASSLRQEIAQWLIDFLDGNIRAEEWQDTADAFESTLDDYLDNKFMSDLSQFPELEPIFYGKCQSMENQTRWEGYKELKIALENIK